MNAKHNENSYAGNGQPGSGRRSLTKGKVATVFALVMAGLVGGASVLLIEGRGPEGLGVVQQFHLQESVASQAAPAQALPAISANAVDHRSPSF